MIKTIRITVAGDAAARARATATLLDVPGLEEAILDGDTLRVAYDLRETSCAYLVEHIEAVGLAPVLRWHERLRLRLRCYREAVLADDLNNEIGWDSFIREIYVGRYRHRRHGRRDDRPRHWRQYTAPSAAD